MAQTKQHLISFKRLTLLLLTIYMIGGYIRRRRKLKAIAEKYRHDKLKKTPLITFSGGGLLGFYFQGVCAYLQDHFDLSNARFAGISAGSMNAAALASGLPIKATIVFGLRWFNMIRKRKFRFFMIPPSLLIETGLQMCEEFGIDEERLLAANRQKNHFFGVTDISSFPPRHRILSTFGSRSESFYAMSCSMRVIPFFRSPGFFRGRYVIDGQFSAMFTIPYDQHPSTVIRVTPSAHLIRNADVSPDLYESSEQFSIVDVFAQPSLDSIYRQFERGYNDGIRCRDKLISKGLKPLPSEQCRVRLDEWMSFLAKYGKMIFFDDKMTSETDFSQLIDRTALIQNLTNELQNEDTHSDSDGDNDGDSGGIYSGGLLGSEARVDTQRSDGTELYVANDSIETESITIEPVAP